MTEKRGSCYAINGFYPSMREKYTAKGASIHYMVVEWKESLMPWPHFRLKVIGATDPSKASGGSLRAEILKNYEELGLRTCPNFEENGVHASASAFEGLCERLNWLGNKLEDDSFGKMLLSSGVAEKDIANWTKDPQIEFGGSKRSLFDLMEHKSTTECHQLALKLSGDTKGRTAVNVGRRAETADDRTNCALVFIKPHANNPAVRKLVQHTLTRLGLKITNEGEVRYDEMDSKRLIDNHYYSIASKAVLISPDALHVPDEGLKKFEEEFKVTWQQAIKDGVVLNARQVCEKYEMSPEELKNAWLEGKKRGDCLRFYGGFYCVRLFAAQQ